MTKSKKIYITASGFFALLDKGHPHHLEAIACFRELALENYFVFSANFSIIRCYGQIKSNISYSLAKQFLQAIYLGDTNVLYTDEATTKAAMRLILGKNSREVSFEEALINVICDRHNIPSILSYDLENYFFGITKFEIESSKK